MQRSKCSVQMELASNRHQSFEGHDDIWDMALSDAYHQHKLQLFSVTSAPDDSDCYSSTQNLKILLEM